MIGVAALLVLLSAVYGVQIEGTIHLDGKTLGIAKSDYGAYLADVGIQVVREGQIIREAFVEETGKFSIQGIDSDGNYTVYFTHPRLLIAPVITSIVDNQVHAFTYDPIRSNGSVPIAHPLVIVPLSNNSPYVTEEPFDALQLLKNPMLIMGLVMLGLVYLMPKMQGSMSPEEMREMRKGLEDEGGFAASLLKNMIPAGSDPSNQGALKDILPSISGDHSTRKRK
jgi:hypothetical protein